MFIWFLNQQSDNWYDTEETESGFAHHQGGTWCLNYYINIEYIIVFRVLNRAKSPPPKKKKKKKKKEEEKKKKKK